MREPMRVIEGTAKPGEAFWRFIDASKAESGETEIEFFGPISEYSWRGDEVTPKTFKDELYAKGKGGPVTVKVNSPGGEVFAAATLRAILQDYPGKVTADIIGLAASAATVVVGGADRIRMRESALMMIHDPSAIAYGTIDEIEQVVEMLKTVKVGIVDGYETKTKLERKKLEKMMKDETWMTAHQAQELGFVDEVVMGTIAKAPKAMRAGFLNCLKGYANVPEGFEPVVEEDATLPSPSLSLEGRGTEEADAPSGAPGAEEVIAVEEPAGAGEAADNEAQELRERVKAILEGEKKVC